MDHNMPSLRRQNCERSAFSASGAGLLSWLAQENRSRGLATIVLLHLLTVSQVRAADPETPVFLPLPEALLNTLRGQLVAPPGGTPGAATGEAPVNNGVEEQPAAPTTVTRTNPNVLMLDSDPKRTRVVKTKDRISVQALDAPVNEVLALIAEQHNLNIVAGQDVTGNVSVTLKELELEEALEAVLAINGYTWTRRGSVVYVSSVSTESTASSRVQGRVSQVFPLHYVSAADLQAVITPLLSPIGTVAITASSPSDQRRASERIVVEDLPSHLETIAARIAEIDQPPQQVAIEAHILQVNLTDDMRHGVDFAALARVANSSIIASSPTFNAPLGGLGASTSSEYNVNIIGSDLVAVLEALQSQTETKTLASPKLMVVNGQEARIQIGGKFGYFVTTTTQTSTLQEVKFLETGVVLRVTPVLGNDGRIMMMVAPEISTGRVVPETGLPEEETTEVETTIILDDGHAMVIGGLITETDDEAQTKLPIIGDLRGVGRFFQRRSVKRNRSEVIIALVPRIVHSHKSLEMTRTMEHDALRATTPLLDHRLQPIIRPEPDVNFPDAMENPRTIRMGRLLGAIKNVSLPRPRPLDYYFPALNGPRPQKRACPLAHTPHRPLIRP